MNENLVISYCGVCCNHCGMRTSIPKMASELKRFIDAYGYAEWIGFITQDFDFNSLMKGLNWFSNSVCPTCQKGGGMPRCEIRTCCSQKKLQNCYFCPEFPTCPKLSYQKATYQVDKHFERIAQIGYENWLKEQEDKVKKAFDNIEYLEKRKRF